MSHPIPDGAFKACHVCGAAETNLFGGRCAQCANAPAKERTPAPTAVPLPAVILATEGALVSAVTEIPAEVVLPDQKPPEAKWPVTTQESATAVLAAMQNRRDRIRRIQEMAKAMVKHEEQEITRLQFAVGGYKRDLGHKVVESWGTLEEWAASQIKGTKRKSVDLPFGRLQFRAVAAAVRVPDEKLEEFVLWCNRTGNTHLYRIHYEVKMTELKKWMEDEKRERPTDEQGVTLVDYYPAARYDTFSVSEDDR